MDHSPGFLRLVMQAQKEVKELSLSEVQKLLGATRPVVLIDVREESEWQAGHLPQAQHLSKGIIERDIEGLYPDLDSKLVLYCGGGYRSILAAQNLQKMGYRQVWSMAGGFRAWHDAQLPLVLPAR